MNDPTTFHCPTCWAIPGEPCGRTPRGPSTPLGRVHTSRVKRANRTPKEN